MKARRTVLCMLVVVAISFGTAGYLRAAETYPAKPVRLIVPFSVGGGVDFAARTIALPLGDAIGQKVIVDNRTGAGGDIAAEILARAKPDGYTLLLGPGSLIAIRPAFYPNLTYHVLRDFQPIARLAELRNILVVNPSLPVHSVKELIALARSKPGEIKAGSAGVGGLLYVCNMLFEHLANVKFLYVPYKGGGPAGRAAAAGEIDVLFGSPAATLTFIESGKLRSLAITSSQRSASLPDLPTIAESGVPGYEMTNWQGLFAPAGTPRAVVEKLSNAAIRSVGLPKVIERLQSRGTEPVPLGPDEFAAFVKKELEKWATVVKATGVTAK